MALLIGNKIENNGASPNGRLTATEFNQLVEQVNLNSPVFIDSKDIDTCTNNGLYYFTNSHNFLIAHSTLSSVMQLIFTHDGLQCRVGAYAYESANFDIKVVEWGKWRSMDITVIEDLKAAVHVVKDDVIDDADDYVEPGLYYFDEVKTHLFVCTRIVANNVISVTQYRFSVDGLMSRIGRHFTDGSTSDEWGEWRPMGSGSSEFIRVIEEDQSACERLTEPGIYYLSQEPAIVTIMRDDDDIYQTMDDMNGTKMTRNGRMFDSEPTWLMWKTIDTEPLYAEEITYSDLSFKRTTGNLIPGRWYRITDYETTVANDPAARSAGHPFDLLVLATSSNSLSEEARAIQSNRDNEHYFADSKLDAWKVWYCLDNDTKRFAWADTQKGKGVIYRLIDEWRNDCPYDFKNIQFKRYAEPDFVIGGPNYDSEEIWSRGAYLHTQDMRSYHSSMDGTMKWFYTFSYGNDAEFSDLTDASLTNHDDVNERDSYGVNECHSNRIEPCFTRLVIDDITYKPQVLNDIVLNNCDQLKRYMYNNTFAANCCTITLTMACRSNSFDTDCCDIYAVKPLGLSVGQHCLYIYIDYGCEYVNIGSECHFITLAEGGTNLEIKSSCSNIELIGGAWIVIGSSSTGIYINCGCKIYVGEGCRDIRLEGYGSESVSIGNGCHDFTFNASISNSTFGDGCCRLATDDNVGYPYRRFHVFPGTDPGHDKKYTLKVDGGTASELKFVDSTTKSPYVKQWSPTL